MESREPETKISDSETEQASDPSLKAPKFDENKGEVDVGDSIEEKEGAEGEEEEGECGFCLFMKGGGCKESFVAWENCIEEAEKKNEDVVEKCFEVTGALKKCMEANNDYYDPILRAEKRAEEEAVNELEKEKQAVNELEKEKEAVDELEKEKQAVDELEKEKQAVNELEKEKQADAPPNSSSVDSEQSTAHSLSVDSTEDKEEAEGEGEDKGECGFCLFMKGGGCKESFIAWDNCIEEAEKKKEDIVEKCFEVIGALKTCMETNNKYYEPILRAEKRAVEEAVNALEKEKQAAAPPNSSSVDSEQATTPSLSVDSEAVGEFEKEKQATPTSSSSGSNVEN